MIVEIRPDRCARSACQAPIDGPTAPTHKDTGLHYCLACARKINRACGVNIVTWIRPL